jgi:aminoglycoside/choline kinase family phosphotransferase
MVPRTELFQQWVTKTLGVSHQNLSPLTGDAGFRIYYRAHYQNNPIIVVDARLPQQENKAFVAIARSYHAKGLSVPTIIESDEEHGFFALLDFGTDHYLDALNDSTADTLYSDALRALVKIQQIQDLKDYTLPSFDTSFMRREFSLFTDWYLDMHLQIKLSPTQTQLLENVFETLLEKISRQPLVSVHRDYHSRNLMVIGDNNPGILDFQDAVMGPITYDLVSLLRDCYISWPATKVDQWTTDFYLQLPADFQKKHSLEEFFIWRDWMGVQRHLKAIGIFSRLSLRDGKTRYLQDIPRTFEHLMFESQHLPELNDFRHFLLDEVLI